MKRFAGANLWAPISLLVGLSVGIMIGRSRGIPFVTTAEQWTIGIYTGDNPFDLSAPFWRWNPVLDHTDVTDARARFVADPFLWEEDGEWHLFFEYYNNRTGQGDLAVASSRNARRWTYEGTVLDEPFHLSYPYVFEWQGDHYMIPETFEANSIRLYRAVDFPMKWALEGTLIEGRDYVDPSIVRYRDDWWLFAATTSNDTLHLFHADALEGPWEEHPASPIVRGDNRRARPGGRPLVYEDRLYRVAQNVDPPSEWLPAPVTNVDPLMVWAYEVTTLTPTEYAERPVRDAPILRPDGSGWNEKAMHHYDVHLRDDGSWIASVDGFGTYRMFGWSY